MQRIIAGGTGFIGRYLIKRWLDQGIRIAVISRSRERVHKQFGDTVKALSWADVDSLKHDKLNDTEVIINLTGANIGDKRWSNKRKQEILTSRLQATETLSQLCAALGDHSPPLFNASAVGTYGLQKTQPDSLPPALDETTPIDFTEWNDFVSEVGRQWEQATDYAKAHGVRVINLRFGVVLGPNGGALKKLELPFKCCIGGPIASGQQPFPWIHLDDIARAIEFLLTHKDIVGPVNFVAPQAINQKQFATALGQALHRPCHLPTPAFMLKLGFGQMAEELLLHGQHVVPSLLTQQGFQFQYPTINAALADIYPG
ncbi:MAG: TIGR01777 family protein [Legionellales bacterium]|nr:TIGR01777 family protein [Legionellales bacterium]|tara:strand:+ start:1547 stop:2491 length:945 start_codon:yes stop_codon:yes gene_type:complete